MRFVCQYPEHPWWNLCVRIAQELAGEAQGTAPPAHEAYRRVAAGRFSLLTPRDMMGALNNPRDVAGGAAEVGITTPTATAVMARRGVGPYGEPHPGLRGIAAYPHDDFLIFLADARFGTSSLREFLNLEVPRTIVTGRVGDAGAHDVLTHCIIEVLEAHAPGRLDGGSLNVTFGGPTRAAGNLVIEGRADGLFHEAQGHPMWASIAEARDMVALEPDADILGRLSDRLGLGLRDIPAGHQVGNDRSIPTLDFSGWLLFVDERLSHDAAYALALACDRARPKVEETIPDRSITKPLDARRMFTELGIPPHSGAEAYAKEQGYL